MNERLKRVYELIPHGLDRTITAAEIAKLTGINLRGVYEAISTLVMKYDIPVGGVRFKYTKGYFIITTEEERTIALQSLKRTAEETNRRIAKVLTLPIL